MTGKNLPPTTGREISGLKARVTDLERALDRVRRVSAKAPSLVLPPFTAMNGYGYSAAGLHTTSGVWRYYQPANTVDTIVVDKTHHITIEATDEWAFRIDIAGTYEIGMAATWATDDGNRALGIQRIDAGEVAQDYPIATMPAATGTSTHLSGSRIVFARAGSIWWPMFADDSTITGGGSCSSFWAVLKALGEPTAADLGGI